MKAEIKRIFGSGDLAASLGVNRGTNKEPGRFAPWATCEIYRLEDGKIREIWGVEDTRNEFLQLGYRMQEPALAEPPHQVPQATGQCPSGPSAADTTTQHALRRLANAEEDRTA